MAKKFENTLDQCIDQLLPRNTLEEWLQDDPEQAAVVAVFCSTHLQNLPGPLPP